ncbi:MAG: hypothetical protein ABIQ99_03275 [Thermoflexales bacterium]
MNPENNPPNPFVGAWELVSGSYAGDDQSVTDYTEAEIKSLKVLSGSRFSFVTTAQGAFYAAGAGEYTAEDGRYAEMPQFASHASMLGQRFEFQYQLDGDTWTNTRWQGDVRVELEVWKRVQ